MGYREVVVGMGLALAGCSSASPGAEPFAPDAAGDVAVMPDARDAAPDMAEDTGPTADAAQDARDAGQDAQCVPLTQAQACAGRNCGLVSDGCSGGYQCTGGGEAGGCPNQQTCGLLTPNVCGGCTPIPAPTDGGVAPCTFAPYLAAYSCPVITADGGTSVFEPPGPGQCQSSTSTTFCCFY